MTSAIPSISLSLEEISVVRGDSVLLEDVSIAVQSGDALQLFGSNGSGKSSLLNVIAGISEPGEGRVEWRNGEGPLQARDAAGAIVFIGHDTSVRMMLTVRENLEYWAGAYGKGRAEIDAAMTRAGLDRLANYPGVRLSAGQKRRIDLARCMLADRPVWILDEPTTSLDLDGYKLWSEEIRRHQERGGLAIIATHHRLDLQSRDIRLG